MPCQQIGLFINARVTVVILCVCVSVTKLAVLLHTSFASPKCGVTRILMAFQTHVL